MKENKKEEMNQKPDEQAVPAAKEEAGQTGEPKVEELDRDCLVELSKALREENTQLIAEQERLKTELEEQKAKYKRAEKIVSQANDVSNLYQRLQVDFENYRKRNAEIVAKAKEEAECQIALKVVPVLDSFLRALESVHDPADRAGLEQIVRQFESALRELGVERMEVQGKPFDLNEHDAVMTVPTEDPKQDDTVANVVANGYRYGDKVMKHAQVIVYKLQS